MSSNLIIYLICGLILILILIILLLIYICKKKQNLNHNSQLITTTNLPSTTRVDSNQVTNYDSTVVNSSVVGASFVNIIPPSYATLVREENINSQNKSIQNIDLTTATLSTVTSIATDSNCESIDDLGEDENNSINYVTSLNEHVEISNYTSEREVNDTLYDTFMSPRPPSYDELLTSL